MHHTPSPFPPHDSSGEIYTSEKHGNDETGDGTEARPYKTAMQALRKAGKEPFPTIYVDGKEDNQVCSNLLQSI